MRRLYSAKLSCNLCCASVKANLCACALVRASFKRSKELPATDWVANNTGTLSVDEATGSTIPGVMGDVGMVGLFTLSIGGERHVEEGISGETTVGAIASVDTNDDKGGKVVGGGDLGPIAVAMVNKVSATLIVVPTALEFLGVDGNFGGRPDFGAL